MNESPKPKPPLKRENLFLNIIFNVVLPTMILSWASGDEWFGPTWGLVVALLFPTSYGIMDFVKRRKYNFISIIGFSSVLITGGFALLELNAFWFAVKEAAIPAIIGFSVLLSMRTKMPLVKEFLYNPQIMNVERIAAALDERQTHESFTTLLWGSSRLLAASFFISSVLNYFLARYLLVNPPGSEAFNGDLAKMQLWSWPVIVVPSMAMMMFALWRFIKGLKKATGLELEELLNEEAAGKKPAASK